MCGSCPRARRFLPAFLPRSVALNELDSDGSVFHFHALVLLHGTCTPFASSPCWAHTSREWRPAATFFLSSGHDLAGCHHSTHEEEEYMTATQTDILKTKLELLQAELVASGAKNIQLNQQAIKKANLSFSGGDGRIYIQPSSVGYDISLSGQSLQKAMFGFMTDLCGGNPDGYKQTKPAPHAPFWRVSNFALVEKAVRRYSQTRA